LYPEAALRHANQKFTRRFGYIEEQADLTGKSLNDMKLAEMEALWVQAKQGEK
jgi:uncharacterized protein YabN with tetrapyrrole methylase and pyrophosphatase domain